MMPLSAVNYSLKRLITGSEAALYNSLHLLNKKRFKKLGK